MAEQRFSVTDLDCGACVARIEAAARAVPGVAAATASLVTGELTVTGTPQTADLLAAVRATGHDIAPLGAVAADPAYRQVLRAVVALNLGYALVEIMAGWVAGSQALRADALDFLGDGLISGLGLLALGWTVRARARAALLQGGFLALMGLWVIGGTLWRMQAPPLPDEAVMGWTGMGALLVNLGCAGLLLRHRSGDAGMRAVWLFSRNDALGNLAVVAAAALVGVTGLPWPDLVVALGIAGLFLGAARIILRDARAELR